MIIAYEKISALARSWKRPRFAFSIALVLALAGFGAFYFISKNTWLSSRILLRMPMGTERKVAIVRRQAAEARMAGRPRDVFSLFPAQPVQKYKDIEYIVLKWDRDYYLYVDDRNADITDLHPQYWGVVLSATPEWPDIRKIAREMDKEKRSQK